MRKIILFLSYMTTGGQVVYKILILASFDFFLLTFYRLQRIGYWSQAHKSYTQEKLHDQHSSKKNFVFEVGQLQRLYSALKLNMSKTLKFVRVKNQKFRHYRGGGGQKKSFFFVSPTNVLKHSRPFFLILALGFAIFLPKNSEKCVFSKKLQNHNFRYFWAKKQQNRGPI